MELESIGSVEECAEYAEMFGVPLELVSRAHYCPTCREAVLVCDNNIWLDVRPVDDGDWNLMKLGPLTVAASGGQPEGDPGSKHTLHEHQPRED